MDDEQIKTRAEDFARKNKNRIAKELTDLKKYIPDEVPFSIFMAGSPGAGKTEYSKSLIDSFEKYHNYNQKVIRIDGDDFRELFTDYQGYNSFLFQGAISILVDRVHDLALDNKQTFLLDGTFSKYEKASNNIDRSLKRNREVRIFYLYQNPEVSWKFTVAREEKEGRNIQKDIFINHFLNSLKTVSLIRENYDERVVIFLIRKNFDMNTAENFIEIKPGGSSLESYVNVMYTKDQLEKLLS